MNKIKYKIHRYAIKYILHSEYYSQLYESEGESKGIIKWDIPIGIKIIQSYQGILR